MGGSHQTCLDAGEHVCQLPSGRICLTEGCGKAAGTWWGKYWCPECDKKRIDQIAINLENALAELRGGTDELA